MKGRPAKSIPQLNDLIIFKSISEFASNTPFDLYKKETNPQQHTLLIIGGIHGDEPGGYFAPAFLEKYYKITSGNLWIIPNLNVDSIMANNRGINGDMNRKFNMIDKKLQGNAELRTFKETIQQSPFLIPLLLDYEKFRREVLLGYLYNNIIEFKDFIQ